ncbi:MAG TPA: hypothetical protein VF717_18465 [Pyrinomonadaceae bacterium]|jgi:hypothetical protein
MRRLLHLLCALVAICCCLGATFWAARTGLSKLNSNEALKSGSLSSAEKAVDLSPSDPDAHYARAITLSYSGDPEGALREYEIAVSLRPRDYFLWLTLGTAREESGDAAGALVALRESVRLAPYYAQPRWQLGNSLLRAGGGQDEAFSEMRRAANSDPRLVASFIDLAWAASGNDTGSVERLVEPRNNSTHLALARFFVRKGKIREALAHFKLAGDVSDKERRSLLQELVAAGHYREAYEVWISGQGGDSNLPSSGMEALIDGSFEKSIDLEETAFGWRIPRSLEGVQASLDQGEYKEGAQSLLLEWKGNTNPSLQVVSQLIQVQPGTRYQIKFSARTSKIVTRGLPVIVISDVVKGIRIAESTPLEKNSNAWGDNSVEFTTGADTSAIFVTVQRQNCSSSPCPMFGKVWLDRFSIGRF